MKKIICCFSALVFACTSFGEEVRNIIINVTIYCSNKNNFICI
jgi:hypothetical protein